MRQIAYSRIDHLSEEFSNPSRAARLMRDYLSKTIWRTQQTLTKNLLLKLKSYKVGFNDVELIANRMCKQKKCAKNTRKEKYEIVSDFMKHKMKNVDKCNKQASVELNKSKDNLSEVVRVKTIVRKFFMDLVDKEISIIWKKEKKRMKQRQKH